jgi:hydroxyethylthiazole kinase-like uncharacterized protein yjeF
MSADQILAAAQMRAAEQQLIDNGSSVEGLMRAAGEGAADWVWRMAAGHRVTVLCGPGNNGGDGWVIAETLRRRGLAVTVIAAAEPKTPAAQAARTAYRGEVLGRDAAEAGPLPAGDVLVDCLFGSGLTRELTYDDVSLLGRLAATHPRRIAVDLPSGVETDSGAALNEGLPDYQLTLALGAWKPAHGLMPAVAKMGALQLVPIGVGVVAGAGQMLRRPRAIRPPAADAHKYARGMLGVVCGQMSGAALLACHAATGAGAGYVKLIAERVPSAAPPDLVVSGEATLEDKRFTALLIGPGLGRDAEAQAKLAAVMRVALGHSLPIVLDADALMLLKPALLVGRVGIMSERLGPAIVTPHEGELAALESAWGIKPKGENKVARALALAAKSGLVVVAKGPDTVIAAPDGAWLIAPRAPSWLSTAGTGDVLAGTIASRLACGVPTLAAAAQGVWLHGEAARLTRAPFTAGELAASVADAVAACL